MTSKLRLVELESIFTLVVVTQGYFLSDRSQRILGKCGGIPIIVLVIQRSGDCFGSLNSIHGARDVVATTIMSHVDLDLARSVRGLGPKTM